MDDDFKFGYSSCPREKHHRTQYIDITNFKVGDKFIINIKDDYTTHYIGLKSIQDDKIRYSEVEINLDNGQNATYNIPYGGPTLKADIYRDYDKFIITITSGINVGTKCVLEIYTKTIYKLDEKFLPDNVLTPEYVQRQIYFHHLSTIINLDESNLVIDEDNDFEVTDYTGDYYNSLGDLIDHIIHTFAYCIFNSLIPQLHLDGPGATLPAVYWRDIRSVVNEHYSMDDIVNMAYGCFRVIFGKASSIWGGAEVDLSYYDGKLHCRIEEP